MSREVDDLGALIAHAGGSAFLWGESSGGVLALEAARHLKGVKAVVAYEPPFIVDTAPGSPTPLWERVRMELALGNSGAAVSIFLKMVGVPAIVASVMRLFPVWRKLVKIAPTLAYDGELVAQHQTRRPPVPLHWASISCRVLVLAGGKSPDWLRRAASALAQALPQADHSVVPGQNHRLSVASIVPRASDFFRGAEREARKRR